MQYIKGIMLAGLLLGSHGVVAGEYSDKLSKCLTASITPTDKTALVRWIFGAVASHPDVADMASLTPKKWDEISKGGAAVFQKLIADKCAGESREAIINEGMAGYSSAFEILGSTAVGGLMSDPAVEKAIADLQKHLSEDKLMRALLTGTPQSE